MTTENVVTINLENMITVGLMVLIFFLILSFVFGQFKHKNEA
jgi:biopolymer transport protein ExbD